MLKKRLLILLMLMLFPYAAFSTTSNLKLVLDPDNPSPVVRGGFCDYNKYLTSLPFNENIPLPVIDGIILKGTGTGYNVDRVFTGKASIAIQINSLKNIKIKLNSDKLFSTGTPVVEIKIQNSSGTHTFNSANNDKFPFEIPDSDMALISEYMSIEFTVTYDWSNWIGKTDAILSENMILALEYEVVD